MPVAPRRRRLGRLAQYTTRTRRHDDRCVRVTLGDFIVDVVTVERTVTDEGYDWTRHLVEQSADLRAVVVIIQPDRHDLTGVGVYAEMQFSPGPACPSAMLLDLATRRDRTASSRCCPPAVARACRSIEVAAPAMFRLTGSMSNGRARRDRGRASE